MGVLFGAALIASIELILISIAITAAICSLLYLARLFDRRQLRLIDAKWVALGNERYTIKFTMIFNQPTYNQPNVSFTTEEKPFFFLCPESKPWVKKIINDKGVKFPLIIDGVLQE